MKIYGQGMSKMKKKLNWTPGTFQYLRLKFWPFSIVKWPKLAIFNSMKRTFYATKSICFCFQLTSFEVDNEIMTMKRIEIIIFIILPTLKSSMMMICKKQENAHISVILARNEKITVLCFLQLLKLKKTKCLYFFILSQNDRDTAILLFFHH